MAFAYNLGTTPLVLRSRQRYNDSQWHRFVAIRSGDSSRIEVDGFIVANGSLPASLAASMVDHQVRYCCCCCCFRGKWTTTTRYVRLCAIGPLPHKGS